MRSARLAALMSPPLNIAPLFDAGGFLFDFTTSATGAGVDTITSTAPGTGTATQGTSGSRPFWTPGSPAGAQFDGIDDRLTASQNALSAMTLAATVNCTGPGVIMGQEGAAVGRSYLQVDSAANGGGLLGGWGTQSSGTIHGGPNILGARVVVMIRGSGSTVELYVNNVRVYTGAANGAITTTVSLQLGALSANGVISNWCPMTAYRFCYLRKYIPDNQLGLLYAMMRQRVL